ncbi:hypothetical protein BDN67DRAFT_976438 [Paxillus ammoniavirescens]|nr:hypothetical protein BDN67DRAFT_976438 [Paxillus ammoniavirescens]
MGEETFRSKPGGEAKWFEIGRVKVKSTTCECNKSLALRRRVQGIEFWDYCSTADGEIHEM